MTELGGQNKIAFESSETTRFLRNLSAVPNSLGVHGLMAILNAPGRKPRKPRGTDDETPPVEKNTPKRSRNKNKKHEDQQETDTLEHNDRTKGRTIPDEQTRKWRNMRRRLNEAKRTIEMIMKHWHAQNPNKPPDDFQHDKEHSSNAENVQEVHDMTSEFSAPIVLEAYDAYKSTTKSPTFHKFMQTKKYTEASAEADEAQRAFIHAQLHEGNPRMIQACHYMTRPAFT